MSGGCGCEKIDNDTSLSLSSAKPDSYSYRNNELCSEPSSQSLRGFTQADGGTGLEGVGDENARTQKLCVCDYPV